VGGVDLHPGNGERLDGAAQVRELDLGVVVQRGLCLGVTRQGLNGLDARAGTDQSRDELGTQRMEVGHSLIGLVRNASSLQVEADRLGGLVMERKDRGARDLVGDPRSEIGG